MSVSFDFQIIDRSDSSETSLIVARNEEAYNYLIDEEGRDVLPNGSALISNNEVGDFISDAGWAHLCCELV